VAEPPDPPWPFESSTHGVLGTDALLDRLERWAADARVDEAARRRSRERWLRQQAEEGATLAGVLLDLAERKVPLSVHTRAGRRHHGVVLAVGADFCALRTAAGNDVLLAMAGIGIVRTQPRIEVTVGDRAVHLEARLAEVVARMAGERERVLLVTLDGGEAVAGELRAAGQDVVTLQLDGSRSATAYVRLDAIGEVSLA
jgi:hypothetical protein